MRRRAGALDIGHGDEDFPVDLVDFMNGANVGMIDRGGGLGFPPQALLSVRVLGEPRREKLEATTDFSKAAFQLLHRRYPKSEWAKKTKYWF